MFLSLKKKKKKNTTRSTQLTTRLNKTDTISSICATSQQVVHWTSFSYSHTTKISQVASILRMIYRWNKQLQYFSITVQQAIVVWELDIL